MNVKRWMRQCAVIMQYTGLSEVTGDEPPTYNCVGTSDSIASYQTMQDRIDRIRQNGTDAMIEVFKGLSHGFGLGTGTVAEGWIDNAVKFWEKQTGHHATAPSSGTVTDASVSDKRIDIPQTGTTKAVPSEYKAESSKKGTVERLDYRSKDYVRNGSEITKI